MNPIDVDPNRIKKKAAPVWGWMDDLTVGASKFTTADRNLINSACTNRRPKKFTVSVREYDGKEGFIVRRIK